MKLQIDNSRQKSIEHLFFFSNANKYVEQMREEIVNKETAERALQEEMKKQFFPSKTKGRVCQTSIPGKRVGIRSNSQENIAKGILRSNDFYFIFFFFLIWSVILSDYSNEKIKVPYPFQKVKIDQKSI